MSAPVRDPHRIHIGDQVWWWPNSQAGVQRSTPMRGRVIGLFNSRPTLARPPVSMARVRAEHDEYVVATDRLNKGETP